MPFIRPIPVAAVPWGFMMQQQQQQRRRQRLRQPQLWVLPADSDDDDDDDDNNNNNNNCPTPPAATPEGNSPGKGRKRQRLSESLQEGGGARKLLRWAPFAAPAVLFRASAAVPQQQLLQQQELLQELKRLQLEIESLRRKAEALFEGPAPASGGSCPSPVPEDDDTAAPGS